MKLSIEIKQLLQLTKILKKIRGFNQRYSIGVSLILKLANSF